MSAPSRNSHRTAILSLSLLIAPPATQSRPAVPATSPAVPAAASAPPPAVVRPAVRRVVAPDGSVFLLAPSGRVPYVFLATAIPGGSVDEPPGKEGMLLATVRASLHGTPDIGSRDWNAEKELLVREDRVVRDLTMLRQAGKAPAPELVQELESVRSQLAQVADSGQFRGRMHDLAATPMRIAVDPDSVVVATGCPVATLEHLLVLLKKRRENACLRGFQAAFTAARRESVERRERDPLQRGREELLTLAFKRHPYRRALESGDTPPVPCSREEALAFYQELHLPGRTATAIVGGFDPEVIEGMLRRVHADSGGLVPVIPAPPAEPEQEGERITNLAPGPVGTFAMGFRIPDGLPPGSVALLAEILGGDPQSLLERLLVRERRVAHDLRVTAPFPGSRYPGLFLIEMRVPAGQAPQLVALEVMEILSALAIYGPPAELFELTRNAAAARWQRRTEDPEQWAEILARSEALRPERVPDRTSELWLLSREKVHLAAAALFRPAHRSLVVTTAAPKPPEGRQ
jgi:hypothetical protein